MWCYGEMDGYQYEAKVYGNPSAFGINNGRISKLYIYGQDAEILACYERGWSGEVDAPPENLKDTVKKIVERYAKPLMSPDMAQRWGEVV